ncbi:M3 family metallopeptidase [Ferrovum sp. PN-J185]|uniref:M3 family metallopeptidase n=1 Tax=Ferrovum sp. PN-J185 TaxID=1356306 RepID=UPI001E4D8159|nr:M3 family metallopeptidase [Ferrovum sp. PN-J185]MCC6068306.1 M3 family metallopeptidase [Ferrovum sp. PN-J185]MDE1892259.1 M3 family metallopeptidase [Betaproteobacteria bacterium]
MNPLLDFSGLPRFDQIQPSHVDEAITVLIDQCHQTLEQVIQHNHEPSWENFVWPLEKVNEELSRAWGQVSHLNSVVNTPELRDAYNRNLPIVTEYWAKLAQNLALYEGFKQLRSGKGFDSLSTVRQKIIHNELRDFRLGGAELSDKDKQLFLQLENDLAEAAAKFEQNLLDTMNEYTYQVTDHAMLSGLPKDVIKTAQDLAASKDKEGYLLTLHAPSYIPVMQYAQSRELREALYYAYATRASELGKPQWDNTHLISSILKWRADQAQLLGFKHYAELSLESKMAKSAEEVMTFLRQLASKAKPYAQQDWQDLVVFAQEQCAIDELMPWDVAYVSEKLRVARYDFSDLEVKNYFPEDKVLEGLFRVIHTLYGLTVVADNAPVWHKDVKFYSLLNQHQQRVGQFYIDLYARPGKRGGAWMDEAITRRRRGHDFAIPVAYLTCNFSAPVGDKPATFTHDEVITLFHEFGHGLHHLLTEVDDLSVSGIHGVEWDAVELPSQFMENFCWEWHVLRDMTRHVDTGESLPQELFQRMTQAKNFQSGMQTVRQIEFALFDMQIHCGLLADQTPLNVLSQIREEVAVVQPPHWHRFPNSFSHIFAGGYAAGYYSYKWAEVLSADAYSLFEENGGLNTAIGHRFREEILSRGGSRPALDSFVAFRGREPTIDALLRHNGMV